MNRRKCECSEQYKGRDCPVCWGTGVIPPVTWKDYQALVELITTQENLLNEYRKEHVERESLMNQYRKVNLEFVEINKDLLRIANEFLAGQVVDAVIIAAFKKRLEKFSSGTGQN